MKNESAIPKQTYFPLTVIHNSERKNKKQIELKPVRRKVPDITNDSRYWDENWFAHYE